MKPPIPLSFRDMLAGSNAGSSVAVSNGTVVVGASGADTAAGQDSGLATVFDVPGGDLDPVEIATLLPSDGTTQGAGGTVAINRELIVVGAPTAQVGGEPSAGTAYIYDAGERLKGRAPLGVRRPKAGLSNRDASAGDGFGNAIALDRKTAIIGVPLDDRVVASGPEVVDIGRADPFVVDVVARSGFE